jgi:hypothetical protein
LGKTFVTKTAWQASRGDVANLAGESLLCHRASILNTSAGISFNNSDSGKALKRFFTQMLQLEPSSRWKLDSEDAANNFKIERASCLWGFIKHIQILDRRNGAFNQNLQKANAARHAVVMQKKLSTALKSRHRRALGSSRK